MAVLKILLLVAQLAAINNLEAKKMNKLLLVVAPQNFRDEEYFDTKKEIEARNIKTETASTSLEVATGTMGGSTKPDLILKNADIKNYDGVIFIGGGGSSIYWNDKYALDIAKKAYEQGKVLGAICIAPRTLANAGLLKGKKFNSWESEVENIKELGGIHSKEDVVVDGKIVTGNGPKAASGFGRKIAELVKK